MIQKKRQLTFILIGSVTLLILALSLLHITSPVLGAGPQQSTTDHLMPLPPPLEVNPQAAIPTGRSNQSVLTPTTALTGPFPALVAEISLAPAGATLTDLLLDKPTNRLYLTDSAGQLHILDATSYERLATLPDVAPTITLDAENKRLYLGPSRYSGAPLTVIDTAELTVVKVISPGGQVALDPGRRRFYLGNGGGTPVPLQIYDIDSLALIEELSLTGRPVYNAARDEIYLIDTPIQIIDPDRLEAAGPLLSEWLLKQNESCNDCGFFQDLLLFPERNWLLTNYNYLGLGKEATLRGWFKYYDATTLAELPEATAQTGVEYDCFGRPVFAEPVQGLIYREEIFKRYVIVANLDIYSLDGERIASYDGAWLGRTNPRTGQMYRSGWVYRIPDLSPVGPLPVAACIDRLDGKSGRLYGLAKNKLVVFDESGGNYTPPRPQAVVSLPENYAASEIIFSPTYSQDQTLFLNGGRIFRSQDAGQSWDELTEALPLTGKLALSPHFSQDRTIFAHSYPPSGPGSAGIYRSTDGGDSWQPMWRGLNHLRVLRLELSPDFVDDGSLTAYTLYRDLSATYRPDDLKSIFHSTDRGQSWRLVATDTHQINPQAQVRFRQLTFDSDTTRPYAFIERSRAGDHGWERVFDLSDPKSSALMVVSADPLTPTVFVYAEARGQILRSGDNGQTWQSAPAPAKLFGLRFSPDFAVDQTAFAYGSDTIFRSADGGRSWQTVYTWPDPPTYPSFEFQFSPNFAADQTLFIVDDERLLHSADGGQNWSLSFDRPISKGPQFSPASNGPLTLFIRSERQVYRSGDGGASWQAVLTMAETDPLSYYYAEVLFSPAYAVDNSLYLISSRHLYRSRDGGLSWQPWADERLSDDTFNLTLSSLSPGLTDGRYSLFLGWQEGDTYRYQLFDPDEMAWRTEPLATEGTPAPPVTSTPTPAAVPVDERYAQIWANLGGESGRLGLPRAPAQEGDYAFQPFSQGLMHWGWQEEGQAYIHLLGRQAGQLVWQRYPDTWQADQPEYQCPSAQPPLGPRRGFGKIWCEHEESQAALGAPLGAEQGARGGYQSFERGLILWHPAEETVFVLFDDGTWQIAE